MYEFSGILCRHGYKVLFQEHVFSLQDSHYLDRWRKDDGQVPLSILLMRQPVNASSFTAEPAAYLDSTGRYNDLLQYCREIARRGSQDYDIYSSVKTSLQDELNRLTIQPKDSPARCKLLKPFNSGSTVELASEVAPGEDDSSVYNPPVSVT